MTLFNDAFTGRIVEDIVETTDESGEECFQLTFVGTKKKLCFYNTDKVNVFISDEHLDTLWVPKVNRK